VTGTAIGFVLGAVVIEFVGIDPVVMWTLLPVVAFGSAFVPEVASFIAGQAAFTMMVLIIFNLIQPTGWSVGLIRVEDVAVGALVGISVSLLLWPRGASGTVTKAVDRACVVGAELLQSAVARVTRGASEDATDQVFALSREALEASRTVDDAVRQYLSESSGKTDSRAPIVRAANRAIRLRAAGELIADVVPPPLDVYPSVRTVLESHAHAVCEALLDVAAGGAPALDVAHDFVIALRAEAGDDELAVSAALPLVTVAASLGELELIYPQPPPHAVAT
jgi:uncharacterized membrane protein YccC